MNRKRLLIAVLVGCLSVVLLAADNTTFTDAFNRADENPLSGSGVWDAGYTSGGGQPALRILSNAVEIASATGEFGLESINSPAFAAAQWGQMTWKTIGTGSNYAGIGVRTSAPATWNGYLCFGLDPAGGDTSYIEKITASAETNLVSNATATWVNGDTLKCRATGTTIELYRNGSLIATTTDGTYTTGRVALMNTGNSVGTSVVDDVTAGDIVTAGPPPGSRLLMGVGKFLTPLLPVGDVTRFHGRKVAH